MTPADNMVAIGFSLIVAGLAMLVFTIGRARSEEDIRNSETREQRMREQLGIFSGRARQFEWAYRATGRHPVLMRLPSVIALIVGVVLIVVGLANQ